TATGTTAWSYAWTPTAPGQATIRSRAVDSSGNTQDPPAMITVTVVSPMQVLSTTPDSGATGVSTGAAPRARFSKSLDPTSANVSTVLLRDAANNLIPGAVSCSPSEGAVALVPQAQLQAGQTYTVTLKGGAAAPHITDSTGIPLGSDYTWSFTTATATAVTGLSIWANSVTPANTIFNDPVAVEVGLKFCSDSNGVITGVRFYKGGAANGGQHTGHLWNSSGMMLGAATFYNETASGWQQA